MSAYTLVKFFHVLFAIIAVGINASYGIWLARSAKEPEHEPHVLRTVKFLDDRIANPAYALLLISGIAMVLISDIWDFSTFWVSTALGLFVVTTLVALVVFTPTLRRQVELAEAGDMGSDEYAKLAQRGRLVGMVLGALVVAIVFLMVTKPTL